MDGTRSASATPHTEEPSRRNSDELLTGVRDATSAHAAWQEWERTFDSVPDLIAILDPQHRILRANRSMIQRLGPSLHSWQGQSCYECVHGLDAPREACPHAQSIADGCAHAAEIHEPRLGGDFLVTCTPLRDEQGQFLGSVHVARDITDRKQAEARIRQQNALMAGINRILQEALTCETEEELGKTCLAVTEEITQSKLGFLLEINSQGLVDTIALSDRGWDACEMEMAAEPRRLLVGMPVRGLFGKVLQHGQPFFTNDPASDPDRIGIPEGHPPLTAFLGVPLVHSARTFGMIGMGNREGGYRQDDLAAVESLAAAVVQALLHKRAELAVARSARRRTLLVEWSARIVSQTSVQELLGTVTEAARELTGARLATSGYGCTSRGFLTVSVPDSATFPRGKFLKAPGPGIYLDTLHAGPSLRLSEAELSGHLAWWGLRGACTPLRGLLGARLTDSLGQPCGLIMVSDKHRGGDFAEDDEAILRQLAAITSLALRHIEARNAADAANAAKSQFLTNMSHELRTPLNAILGMTELVLAESDLSPVARDCLQTARQSADLLLELVNQILDFSRIEAGSLELDVRPFGLRETLARTLKPLEIRASQKGLELDCQVQADVPERVLGDPLGLRQVLVNLVGNAVKFTPTGRISVRVGAAEKTDTDVCLHFSVADTGIGISLLDQRRIFAPFTQADASLSRQYGGTGLGLTVSNRLVTMMNGRMWLESSAGTGSTFHFTVRLPLAPHASPTPEFNPATACLHDVPVLIVDDDPDSRHQIQEILAAWSMKPVGVPEVIDALPKLHEAMTTGRPFPLVIARAKLPRINGMKLAGWIRNDPRMAGSVILIASTPQQQAMPPDSQPSDVLWLQHPISQQNLLTAVTRAIVGSPASAAHR